MSAYASEQGHYYKPDGTPAYMTVGANGKERPTTLRDARKHGLLPSVTTIIRTAASPGLERWKAEQVLLAGLTLPRREGEPEKDWIGRVWEDSREQGRLAAEKGTEIHAAIEKHLRGEPVDPAMQPYVAGSMKAIEPLNLTNIRPERSFASRLGYGGKTDLVGVDAGMVPHVLDFKGKDGDLTDVRLYYEHPMQLAAYAHGLGLEDARLGIVFVSRTEPGTALLKMVAPEDAERGWQMFLALLSYWQAAHDYRPGSR